MPFFWCRRSGKKNLRFPRLFPRQVKISGQENLPQKSEACVYVANHQSFMDILSVYQLHGGKSERKGIEFERSLFF